MGSFYFAKGHGEFLPMDVIQLNLHSKLLPGYSKQCFKINANILLFL